MKIYIYNCNHLNEFIQEVETDHPEWWKGTYTDIPPVECDILGKSFAWNPSTEDWDILIDDWRGTTFYSKTDSRLTRDGGIGPKPEGYVQQVPPDNTKKYTWDDEFQTWQEYVLMVDPKMVIKQYEDAIQAHIDNVAKARGYDNGYTCTSYFDDKNARYASDARVFKDWRSDVWVQVNALLNSYSSEFEGADQIPAAALIGYPTPQDVIAQLPVIEWEDL